MSQIMTNDLHTTWFWLSIAIPVAQYLFFTKLFLKMDSEIKIQIYIADPVLNYFPMESKSMVT